MQTLRGSREGSVSWVSASYMGDLDRDLGSWLLPGPDPAIEGIWEVNHQMGLLCLSVTQIT